MLFLRVLKGLFMNKKEELTILIKAVYRACQVLNMDKNTQNLLGIQCINPALKGHDIIQVTHDKKILTEFISFYRILHDFCGGDVAFMNHWLDAENKALAYRLDSYF